MMLQGTGHPGRAAPLAPGRDRGGLAIPTPLGTVLPRSGMTPPLTIPTGETGRGRPSPEPAAAPRHPCARRSPRFRQTLLPVLSRQQKPVVGLPPGTAQVATALGAGSSPRTGAGCRHPSAGGFAGLGKVLHPKRTLGCPYDKGPGQGCAAEGWLVV